MLWRVGTDAIKHQTNSAVRERWWINVMEMEFSTSLGARFALLCWVGLTQRSLAVSDPRLYRCFDSALIPPTQILPRPLYSVIKVILIQKLHFPHPSSIIICEAYFKCRVINHVMVEAPPGLWACLERFPFMSGRLLLVSSHLKSTSHTVNHLAFVEEKSNLHTNYCEMFAWKFMLQRSNADLDGRAKAPFLLLISHLYSFIFSIILSSAQSFSPIPLFFWGRKYFLSSSCSNCHLPTSLKDRKVGVWAANHWFQLPDHLGKNMCGEMNE